MALDVVIVTYRSAEHIAACLATLPADANVIVVDNASGDAGAELAEQRGAQVVRNAGNLGFARAANQGAALGQGEQILFLNPDARVAPGDLQRLTAALDADPTLAIVGPRLVGLDGAEQRAIWPLPAAGLSWREALGLHRLWPEHDARSRQFVVGACFLVRRSAFEQLGGFDQAFWLYGEETDLCRRAWEAGWSVKLEPAATAEHIGGASGESLSDTVFEHFHRGTERCIYNDAGPVALLSYRLAVVVGTVARLLAARLTGVALDTPTAKRRRILARTLHALIHHPFTVAPAPQASAGMDLVVCSLEAWDDVWRRNQYLVRELLASGSARQVLFVEPPIGPLAFARHPELPLPESLDGTRLARLRPVKPLPRSLGRAADVALAWQVRTAVRRLGMTNPVLWVNDSNYANLADAVAWATLYDITDDWLLAEAPRREARRRQRSEERLLARAETVVVCSPALAASRGSRRRISLVANAVDVERYAHPQPRPADLPPAPLALYVGTVHGERVDIPLVCELAARLTVVLVGPVVVTAEERAALADAGVHVLGPRPHATVPAYLQHGDVVIVPHVVSPFTESLDPIKAYECLAVGRPTVATPVAGFRDLGPPIHVEDRAGYADAVVDLAFPRRPSEPRRVATWSDRATAFAACLDEARLARTHGAQVR